jgi:HEAT repeat protein
MKRLATSLIDGIIQDRSGQDSAEELVERAYRDVGRAGGFVTLSMSSNGDFWLVSPEVQEPYAVTSLLDEEGRTRRIGNLREIFERAGIRALLFLPNVALLEFELAIALIRGGGEFLQLKLMERLVHRVMVINVSPMLLVKRPVSVLVASALDAVFLTMTGIDRAGCGDEHGPDQVLAAQGEALLRLIDDPQEMAIFLASLDLVLHSYPAEVQRGVLRLLSRAVPDGRRKECEQALDLLSDAPDEAAGVRKEVVTSALSSMRGEEVTELSFARRPPRVRRIRNDTQPGPTLPMAIPPPLLPVEQVAKEHLSEELADSLFGGESREEVAFKEESIPGIILEHTAGKAPVVSLGDLSTPEEGMEDRVATYRERSSQLLSRASAATASEYPQCIRSLAAVAEHLLDDGEYGEAWGLVRFLLSQEHQTSRGDVASKDALIHAHSAVFKRERTVPLCEALPHADFAEQGAILEFLRAFGASAMQAMLDLNASYYLGPTLRRILFAVMETTGSDGADTLAEYLRANKSRLHRLTPLIEILGTIDRGRQRELLVFYSRHTVPAVRKSALAGLYRSLGKDAEPLLMDAVKDQDPSVCQTAITLLATSRCMVPEFIEWLHRIVMSPNPTDVREEGVLVAALRALGALGNVPLTPTRQVEEVLLDRLGLAKSGWLRRGMRLENDLSPRVQEAFCSTLGSVGTEHSAQALKLFLDDGLPAVRSRAKEALDRIRARGSMMF